MLEVVTVEDMYFVKYHVNVCSVFSLLPYVCVFSISCLGGYVLENWTILQRQRDCWLQRNLLLYYILYSSRPNQRPVLQISDQVRYWQKIKTWGLNIPPSRVPSGLFGSTHYTVSLHIPARESVGLEKEVKD